MGSKNFMRVNLGEFVREEFTRIGNGIDRVFNGLTNTNRWDISVNGIDYIGMTDGKVHKDGPYGAPLPEKEDIVWLQVNILASMDQVGEDMSKFQSEEIYLSKPIKKDKAEQDRLMTFNAEKINKLLKDKPLEFRKRLAKERVGGGKMPLDGKTYKVSLPHDLYNTVFMYAQDQGVIEPGWPAQRVVYYSR